MAAPAKFYDAVNCAISFANQTIEGWADGEFVTIENMSDGFTSVVGTDGEVARSKSSDRRVKVTLKLLQTSKANAALTAIHNLDLNAPNGAGVGSFQFMDLIGGSMLQGDQAWIVKFPDSSYDRTAKSREWVIEVAVSKRREMGN